MTRKSTSTQEAARRSPVGLRMTMKAVISSVNTATRPTCRTLLYTLTASKSMPEVLTVNPVPHPRAAEEEADLERFLTTELTPRVMTTSKRLSVQEVLPTHFSGSMNFLTRFLKRSTGRSRITFSTKSFCSSIQVKILRKLTTTLKLRKATRSLSHPMTEKSQPKTLRMAKAVVTRDLTSKAFQLPSSSGILSGSATTST